MSQAYKSSKIELISNTLLKKRSISKSLVKTPTSTKKFINLSHLAYMAANK